MELRDLLRCPHMHSLRELSLDDNELESEGAVYIAEGVQVSYEHTCIATYCKFTRIEIN